jgi:hypothetical protein
MIGTKLYQKKSQVYVFLALYGLLALAGCAMAVLAVRNNQNVSGGVGFMIVFGLGMAVNTLIKSRKAQVSVYEDFMEVEQSRRRTLRYRNMTGVSRPNKNRMIITSGSAATTNETIWTQGTRPSRRREIHDF